MSLKIVCLNAQNYLGIGFQYVTSLQAMVARFLTLPHEFIVFTDDTEDYPEPIVKRSLPHPGLAGWWNKIALFKPGVFESGDQILYLDLDTLLTGSIDDIAGYDGEHARLAPFFSDVLPPFSGPQSGLMAWEGGFGEKIWRAYELTGYPQNLKGGDQALLNKLHPRPDLLQPMFPGKIGSFKGEGGIIQSERSILCFHGLPRMHQVFPHGWADATVPIQDGRKFLGGFWWPVLDADCWPAMLASVDEHVSIALQHTKGRKVCVQAGGNVGVFPMRFAEHFAKVLTFEPDEQNFACLIRNARGRNVTAFSYALGDDSAATVSLTANPSNAGQTRVAGEGNIGVVRIDDFDLAECDLIYLDIEGYEMTALRGAADTIRRCKPTIIIEDNGLSEHYGIAKGETPAWICREFGYTIATEIGRDVIMTAK